MSDDDTFVCESCGHRRMNADLCEHDWNIHTWCMECCKDNGYIEEPRSDTYKDDLD